jgi:hypothetical protein
MKIKPKHHYYHNFEKNLPEIIRSPKNSLHNPEDPMSFDSTDNFIKNSAKFIPFIKERDGVGRLLSTVK